jgi:hypothetical protein
MWAPEPRLLFHASGGRRIGQGGRRYGTESYSSELKVAIIRTRKLNVSASNSRGSGQAEAASPLFFVPLVRPGAREVGHGA